MKDIWVVTENMSAFARACDALRDRGAGVPGLGLVHSAAGRGKTTAKRWYAGQPGKGARGVEAIALWTPRWMLRDIAQAYGMPDARGTTEDLFRLVRGLMETDGMPLIIDEADYLLRGRLLLAAVRDLHDVTTVPIVLIGNEHCAAGLLREPKVWSRISQVVEFVGLAEEEMAHCLNEWTGLGIKQDALEMLARETGGDFRLVVVACEHLERAATTSNIKEVGLDLVRRVVNEKMVKSRLAKAIGKARGGRP